MKYMTRQELKADIDEAIYTYRFGSLDEEQKAQLFGAVAVTLREISLSEILIVGDSPLTI